MTSDPALPDLPLPYLTADLLGIGGTLKQEPGDFIVEEIPAYLPSGEGEHLYLWIEKTGITTEQLTRHIVQTLRVPNRDIGTAAIKDRQAIARQQISIPAKFAGQVELLESPSVRVLSAKLHGNKLRTGHLQGNRFTILMRDVAANALELAEPIAERLRQLGVPNYFGDQRFGTDGETARLGFDLLKGLQTPEDIHPARRHFLLKLALSAAQSRLFNQSLSERLLAGDLQRVIAGDVLQVVASGGVFVCSDVAADQPRFDAREVVPTGPMFGPKMKVAAGSVEQSESRLMERCGLTPADFCRYKDLTSGTRRPYLIFPQDLTVSQSADGLLFQFSLPSGSYATVVLREFQKDAALSMA